jgi:uncharacterized membrane protein YcaP (DUF421 family)
MLGAIVAPPMETPERGILQGILILFLVLLLNRSTALLSVKRPRAGKIIQGSLDICVKNGILQLDVLRRLRISRPQLFELLRTNQIYNLGKVDRLYMEAGGNFSIFTTEESRPGLSLLPPADDDIHTLQHKPDESLKACTSCGNTVRVKTPNEPCPNCGNTHWDTAVS